MIAMMNAMTTITTALVASFANCRQTSSRSKGSTTWCKSCFSDAMATPFLLARMYTAIQGLVRGDPQANFKSLLLLDLWCLCVFKFFILFDLNGRIVRIRQEEFL